MRQDFKTVGKNNKSPYACGCVCTVQYIVLPCCCVMFVLRLGEGRGLYSTVPVQLAKLLGGCGCRWGGTGAKDRAVGGGIAVSRPGLWRG